MNVHASFSTATPGEARVVNGMSVDVEEAFQVGAFETTIAKTSWDGLESRVVANTLSCLELFAETDTKATFFTLGWIAERHPQLVRQIVDAGHELASHGWDHRRVFTMTREEFRADVARTQAVLEDAGGVAIRGYRAPSFSIDARTPWAHEELARAGYAYSSSVAPVVHDHYGWSDAPRFAFKPLPWSDLVEIPVTTAILGGRRVAAGGGGFFRVLPYAFSRWAIRQARGRDRRYRQDSKSTRRQQRADDARNRSARARLARAMRRARRSGRSSDLAVLPTYEGLAERRGHRMYRIDNPSDIAA